MPPLPGVREFRSDRPSGGSWWRSLQSPSAHPLLLFVQAIVGATAAADYRFCLNPAARRACHSAALGERLEVTPSGILDPHLR